MIRILILIFLVRITLIFLPSFKIDMNSWQAWSARLVEVTPIHFYAPNYFADYFPGYLYMLWFLGKSFTVLFPHISIFSLSFEFYLKLFTNIFDLATAYYIYKIVSNYQKKAAFMAVILYLLNPALIFNSSVWGQVDGILAFFLVYSVYPLLELKQPYRFSIFLAFSALIKPQGLAIFPVSLIYLIKNFPKQQSFSILVIPILMILSSVPFFLKDPILGLYHLLQKSASTYPYTSMFSYNFWSFAGFWVPDSTIFLGITYQIWGLILFSVALLIIILPLKKVSINQNKIYYLAIALSSMAFFLFLTRIHQRYLFPFFAFLLIAASIKNSIKLIAIYILLSLVHFINLWYVYYYYNFVYPNPTFSPSPVFKFLAANYNLFTIINLVGFTFLILIYYKSSFLKNYAKEIS